MMKDSEIFIALFGEMPRISESRSGFAAITLSVSSPNLATSFFAVDSRTPLTAPEERYKRIEAAFCGSFFSTVAALNCSP